MDKRPLIIFALIVASAFFFGCVKKDTTSFSNYLKTSDELIMTQVQPVDTCVAFVCTERSKFSQFFNTIFSAVGITDPKPSLDACQFKEFNISNEKDKQLFNDTLNNKTEFKIRSLAIGQGPTISAADEARKFCKGYMGLAVEQLGGSKTVDPRPVDTNTTVCAAESDMIPIYLYEAQVGRVDYTYKIATDLTNKGPAIVVPGALFNVTDSSSNSKQDPSCEFKLIQTGCPNCLVGTMVKFNDTKTLESYNKSQSFAGVSGCSGRPMDSIDVILFDLNLNEMECDAQSVRNSFISYVAYISSTWKKPIIVYVRGLNSSSTAGCVWNQSEVRNAYVEIFGSAPMMMSAGLVGVVNSDLASMYEGSNQSELFKQWADACTFYYSTHEVGSSLAITETVATFGKGGARLASECSKDNPTMSYIYTPDTSAQLPLPVPLYKDNGCDGSACAPKGAFIGVGQPTIAFLVAFEPDWQKYCNSWNGPVRQFSGYFQYDPSIIRAILAQDQFISIKPAAHDANLAVCSNYSKDTKTLCNAVYQLSYYYTRAKERASSSDKSSYKPYYLSIIGYKDGNGAFNSALDDYGSSRYSFGDSAVLSILANAWEIKNNCGICKEA